MAPDWLRFLTPALGLAVSFGFYGSPTAILTSPADFATGSLQQAIAAETDSGDESGTEGSGGGDQGSGSGGGEGSSDDDGD